MRSCRWDLFRETSLLDLVEECIYLLLGLSSLFSFLLLHRLSRMSSVPYFLCPVFRLLRIYREIANGVPHALVHYGVEVVVECQWAFRPVMILIVGG